MNTLLRKSVSVMIGAHFRLVADTTFLLQTSESSYIEINLLLIEYRQGNNTKYYHKKDLNTRDKTRGTSGKVMKK